MSASPLPPTLHVPGVIIDVLSNTFYEEPSPLDQHSGISGFCFSLPSWSLNWRTPWPSLRHMSRALSIFSLYYLLPTAENSVPVSESLDEVSLKEVSLILPSRSNHFLGTLVQQKLFPCNFFLKWELSYTMPEYIFVLLWFHLLDFALMATDIVPNRFD